MESDLDIKEELLDTPIAWAVYRSGVQLPFYATYSKSEAMDTVKMFWHSEQIELREVPGSVVTAWLHQKHKETEERRRRLQGWYGKTFLDFQAPPGVGYRLVDYRLVGTQTGRITVRSSNLSS